MNADTLLSYVRICCEHGRTQQEIADALNGSGLTTRKGNPFGARAISKLVSETRELDLTNSWPAVPCLYCPRPYVRRRVRGKYIAMNLDGTRHNCGGSHE